MRQHPDPNITKSAKERLLDSAGILLERHGANVSLREIAHHADTNVSTAEKHFGDVDGLLSQHVFRLLKQASQLWPAASAKHLHDIQGVPLEEKARRLELSLQDWLALMQAECLNPQSAHCQIARLSAQLADSRSPLLAQIQAFRQRERELIAGACEVGGFREGSALADILVLLIDGARNERGMLGFYSPARKLKRYADAIMNAHRYRDEDDPPLPEIEI